MPGHKRQSSRGRKRRAEVYESQRHSELQQRVEGRNLHMPYTQFIGHQLVRMLAVRLAQVLMQQDAMAYGKASIHAIDQQEYEICHVARSENERAYEEEQDICHSEGTRCYGSRRTLVGFVYDVAFVRNAEIHQFGCKKQGRD